jgi:hypothetical protein
MGKVLSHEDLQKLSTSAKIIKSLSIWWFDYKSLETKKIKTN